MKVALAISSYAGDMSALDLVAQARSGRFDNVFDAVAVIDSGPEDRCAPLRDALVEHHPGVEYRWHEDNLGSAGNLVARLRWAMNTDADALLAVNADGVLIPENIARMLACSTERDAAAVYPTHVIEGDRVDLSGRRRVPILPSRAPLARLVDARALKVRWGSSNGALYRLDAFDDVPLWDIAALWYGWEDLGIGLSLDAAGHRQWMSVEATQPTRADQKQLSGTYLVVSSKEPWTTYYGVRNLVLLSRMHPKRSIRIVMRIVREFVMILLRDRRSQRYGRGVRGLLDGVSGRTGQRIRPAA